MRNLSPLRYLYHQLVTYNFRIMFFKIRTRWIKGVSHLLKGISYWPLIFRDSNLRKMHIRLEKFRNAYSSQRCFIMGNGPSLNKMKLELLRDENVWGSNRCYLLFNRVSWRPKFYVAVDSRVVPDNANEINQLPSQLPDTNFFFPVHFRYMDVLNSASNVYWYKEVAFRRNNLPFSMFSLDASRYVYSVKTVTVSMLQLAAFMGFNPIYLFGCDTSYQVSDTVKRENDNPALLTSTTDDPNHFDPSYFGKGKKWHDPGVENMIFNYEQAKKVCDSAGIKVYNATIGGDLEVFPRVNYMELF